MKTRVKPKTKFQQPGDICESCRPIWDNSKPPQEPKVMVDLGVTTEGGIPIVVCPWCDGDLILRLPKE